MPQYRKLLIAFGDSGYVALRRHDGDQVTVLALRHYCDACYRASALCIRSQLVNCAHRPELRDS